MVAQKKKTNQKLDFKIDRFKGYFNGSFGAFR
ncbi:hypothetical protein HPSA_07855 [Helicobacter pylori SouthAfrica7]|uniref:Uncharacterized protein n=1 Tax=Helicobacter pylori (strain SouthAfrica7) TaxID=907239 RepID=E8QUW2_HELPW|nr:hypothetical protein HPSA_07855 [Helicobacter pylori SouthAfrica7]